mmetsp:Transcript_33977/g.113339  ORF Transcript_33977/g.113339 Transcript_33977/m.113339 type:complete len:215 (-) Transcript_33977:245-889(-)
MGRHSALSGLLPASRTPSLRQLEHRKALLGASQLKDAPCRVESRLRRPRHLLGLLARTLVLRPQRLRQLRPAPPREEPRQQPLLHRHRARGTRLGAAQPQQREEALRLRPVLERLELLRDRLDEQPLSGLRTQPSRSVARDGFAQQQTAERITTLSPCRFMNGESVDSSMLSPPDTCFHTGLVLSLGAYCFRPPPALCGSLSHCASGEWAISTH